MKGWHVFLVAILGLVATPFIGIATESHDVIEQAPTGQINWSRARIAASGQAEPEDSELPPKQARQSATIAAVGVARENLLKLIKTIRIDSNTSVNDILVASDTIQNKLKEILGSLKPVQPIRLLPEGIVEVTLQMPLNGPFAQLVLPADIKQIEPIKQVSPPKPNPQTVTDSTKKTGNATAAPSKPVVYTGMIVDAKGLGEVRPAVVLKIVDESGQEVYGPAFVSREYAIQSGMNGYTRSLDSAKFAPRVKDNPLIVKGLKTKNLGRSVIVVSNSDAAKVRQASEHLSFLRKCGVIIVLE